MLVESARGSALRGESHRYSGRDAQSLSLAMSIMKKLALITLCLGLMASVADVSGCAIRTLQTLPVNFSGDTAIVDDTVVLPRFQSTSRSLRSARVMVSILHSGVPGVINPVGDPQNPYPVSVQSVLNDELRLPGGENVPLPVEVSGVALSNQTSVVLQTGLIDFSIDVSDTEPFIGSGTVSIGLHFPNAGIGSTIFGDTSGVVVASSAYAGSMWVEYRYQVPVPATLLILCLGVAGLAFSGRSGLKGIGAA